MRPVPCAVGQADRIAAVVTAVGSSPSALMARQLPTPKARPKL